MGSPEKKGEINWNGSSTFFSQQLESGYSISGEMGINPCILDYHSEVTTDELEGRGEEGKIKKGWHI